MRIFEHQGKDLYKKYGIPVPAGRLIDQKREIRKIFPDIDQGNGVVLKAQVLTGGRGKVQGIRFAKTVAECESQYDELIGMNISGHPVRKILVEEKVKIQRELYLGIIIDTEIGQPVMMICSRGGADVEEISKSHPECLEKIAIDVAYGLLDYPLRGTLIRLGLSKELFPSFMDISRKLYRFFIENDALFAEINPLILNDKGSLIAADARIDIDGAALYRHPEIQEMKASQEMGIEDSLRDKYQLEYVELDGNIGLISGGAGLTMTAIDFMVMEGGRPACFMDCSANVSPTGYEMALRTLNSRKEVDCILMNIFGGITRMDRVGEYILEALKRIGGVKKPLVIRLEGTDAVKGRAFIRDAGLPMCETFAEAVQQAVALGGKNG
ncbi:MAG: succinate--CoA ligase subunit beta [Syntrophobacterales bacterium CG03_land_8_20_14_0_80_58_14]|nr:MAG: succinate--CoA ligase subunit beta [Syntrophobacterales bacterium CG03_land_8_20_14_0_80_58_14]